MSTLDRPTHPPLIARTHQAIREARVRPLRTMRQWASDELVIPNGPYQGERFRIDRQPVLGLLLDEFDSGRWVERYTTGPSQSAKTFGCWVIPIGYHIAELGEDLVAGVPDMRMADNKWQEDLKPAFHASPTLRRLLPVSGPGSEGGKVTDVVRFTNGATIKWMSRGGSDQGKAGFTARVIAVTEAAGFSISTESSVEAEPLKQLEARQRSWDFPDRCTYVEGTLTIAEQLPWAAREESSRSRIVSPCPYCGNWICPERQQLKGWQDATTEVEAEDRAFWECPICSEHLTEEDRRESVADCTILHGDQWVGKGGTVEGDLPPTRRLWFHWQAWHNMFVSTQTLGREEWEANRKPEDSPERESAERELCQFVFSQCYVPASIDSTDLDPRAVASRRNDALPRGVLPKDTQHVTIGIDLGKYTGWWFGLAARECGQLHCFDFGSFDIPSDQMPLQKAITQALVDFYAITAAGWPIYGDTTTKTPSQVWVDAGYQPDAVFDFIKSLGSHNARKAVYMPIVGRGSSQMQQIYQAPQKVGGRIVQIGQRWHVSKVQKHRAFEVLVDADHWKEILHNHLAIPNQTPGALGFFLASQRDLERMARHLTNEKRMTEFVAGRGMITKWVRVGQQHWLDCAYLARAAADRAGWRPSTGG